MADVRGVLLTVLRPKKSGPLTRNRRSLKLDCDAYSDHTGRTLTAIRCDAPMSILRDENVVGFGPLPVLPRSASGHGEIPTGGSRKPARQHSSRTSIHASGSGDPLFCR